MTTLAPPPPRRHDREPDAGLLAGLRAGDEAAFRALVTKYHPALRRVAMSYVNTAPVADEVVQDTWLAVIRGLPGFEERASLKTWIFRILVNRARSRAVREQRTTPFSCLGPGDCDGPTVDPERFIDGTAVDGYWSICPSRFFELPEERLLAAETRAALDRAIGELPTRQQQVVTLRDVQGWDADEVCQSLGLSAGNQRVLLHRARAFLRGALEAHFNEEPTNEP